VDIPADQYSSIDIAIEKILLIKKYVLLREGTTEPAVLDRLKKKTKRFTFPPIS